MKKSLLILMVVAIGCSVFSQTEKMKTFLQANYEKNETEMNFVSYVGFLIYQGREQCKPKWLDEAEKLLNEYEWISAEKRVKTLREYHMSRAAFLTIPERFEYLKKYEQELMINGKDSFSVVLADAERQIKANEEEGSAVSSPLLLARKVFLKAEMDAGLAYLEALLDYGQQTYFTDAIYKSKLDEIMSRLCKNPLTMDNARFCLAGLRVDLVHEHFEDALQKINQLKMFNETDLDVSELRRLCARLLVEYNRDHLGEGSSFLSDDLLERLRDCIKQIKQAAEGGR